MNAPIITSIVVPVYNEAPCLEELYARLAATARELKKTYEIIFVDDGSRDGSLELLRGFKNRDASVRVIALPENLGQQEAVWRGFQASRGGIVVQLDSDLQNPPEEIPKLIVAMTPGVDLVCTRPSLRRDRPWRVWASRLAHRAGTLLFPKDVSLNLGSFRAMRKSVVDRMQASGDRRYMAALMSQMNLARVEIAVEHHPRPRGQTKYNFLSLARLARVLVVEGLKQNFSRLRPGKLFVERRLPENR